MSSSPYQIRFRHHGALVVAALIAAIGAVPLAASSWYLAPVVLVPLVVAAWAWRAGTDAGPDGLRLRAVLGSRRVPWPAVAELVPQPPGHAAVRLRDGSELRLPAVRPADLPKLVAASGQPLAQ